MVTNLSFTTRAKLCKNSLAKALFELMDLKKTNLALSADVTTAEELIQLADQLGSEICLLKTHIDIIQDFTPSLSKKLVALAKEKQFFIFEDRKFADIGHTVKHQYEGGLYRIADWADIVNAHILPGPGIVDGLAEIGRKKTRGLLLLAEMSSAGNLMDENYRQQTLKIAQQYPDFVIGFITQRALSKEPTWLNMTPGVQLEAGNDQLGQQYVTPEIAINQYGSDIIIVGRGILAAQNRLEMAKCYREKAWECYQLNQSC